MTIVQITVRGHTAPNAQITVSATTGRYDAETTTIDQLLTDAAARIRRTYNIDEARPSIPDEVLDLITAVEDYEDDHAPVHPWPCLRHNLAAVPADIRDAAHARQEAQS